MMLLDALSFSHSSARLKFDRAVPLMMRFIVNTWTGKPTPPPTSFPSSSHTVGLVTTADASTHS